MPPAPSLAAPSTAEHGGHGAGAHGTAAGAAGHDHAAGAGCPEDGAAEPVTEAPLQFPARLDAVHAAALQALAATSEPLPCGAIAAAGHGHGDGHGHGAAAATAEVTPLVGEEAARFDAQWAAATTAAAGLASPEQAAAAGYVKASPQVARRRNPLDRLDPRRRPLRRRPPVDAALRRAARAAGDPRRVQLLEPQQRRAPRRASPARRTSGTSHAGLCFVDGWLFQEGVPSADACGGDWLAGDDLWMLHAWVVADRPNPAGRFAGRHEALCPADFEPIADALTSNPVGN